MPQTSSANAARHQTSPTGHARTRRHGPRQVMARTNLTCPAIKRIALKARGCDALVPTGLSCLPSRAMDRVNAAIDALNRCIVNGQESASATQPKGQTWHDLFSSQRIAQEHDELWIKRAAGNTIAGYAAVKWGAALGCELGLITIGPEHRGQGLAKELIGAILETHPSLQLYVGERNLRAQALYFSFAKRGCKVQQIGHKFYGNGERALGIWIQAPTAQVPLGWQDFARDARLGEKAHHKATA